MLNIKINWERVLGLWFCNYTVLATVSLTVFIASIVNFDLTFIANCVIISLLPQYISLFLFMLVGLVCIEIQKRKQHGVKPNRYRV